MNHDIRDIPDPESYGKKVCCRVLIKSACYNCGLWFEAQTEAFNRTLDCEKLQNDATMTRYQSGGALDPFVGYRYGSTKETRPGLVKETIDRNEYDAFMKGL